MKNLKGKSVLVTGASRGIGSYIVNTLAKEGLNIICVARSEDELNKAKLKVEELGSSAHVFPFDLQNIRLIPELINDIRSEIGEIDILVNNAGIEMYRKYGDYSARELNSILAVNLHAPMELTRLLLPGMLDRGAGHVVNVASLAGCKGVAYNSIYSATKAGMIMWSEGLRQELKGTGVGVSTIKPGYISEAGMFHNSGQDAPKLLGTSPPQAVADAVIRAIKGNKAEIIVNKGPIKPLLALNVFTPVFGDSVVRWFGVQELSAKRVE